MKAANWILLILALLVGASGAGATHNASLGRHLLGRSEQGRPIFVSERGAVRARVRLLVVGCVHGNECAGTAVVRDLTHAHVPAHSALRLIENLNPDGAAARTRGDARGVDLNRNFPWRWRRLHGLFDSGPRPLSERESRIAYRLVRTYRPTVSIWFHQHERLVDDSGGDRALERRFARRVGLPLRRLQSFPGSAVGWENHVLPSSTAFVVELPPGSLTAAAARRYAAGVLSLAR